MDFKYLHEPMDEIEKPASELEDVIEIEITIYEPDKMIDERQEYLIPNDDYMLKEADDCET